jgi:hypothetical protein
VLAVFSENLSIIYIGENGMQGLTVFLLSIMMVNRSINLISTTIYYNFSKSIIGGHDRIVAEFTTT